MVVAYDGSAFAGFQFQPGKVRTVQGDLEKSAARLFIGCSRMVGASRTDGGAHAYGQVVHFDIAGSRDSLETDQMFFNSFLPADVKVLSMEYAQTGFDSHFSSLGKTYEYRITSGTPDPTRMKHAWWPYDRWCERSRGKPLSAGDMRLDVGAMREAAQALLGTHDFSAFMDARRPAGLGSLKRKKPHLALKGIKPVRTAAKNTRALGECSVVEAVNPITGSQEVTITVTGDGFLYRMVRMIAAALVEVGHRRISAEKLRSILEAADRKALPEAAPPHGLYLMRVWYPEARDGMLARCADPAARAALAVAISGDRRARVVEDDDGDGPPAAKAEQAAGLSGEDMQSESADNEADIENLEGVQGAVDNSGQ